MGLLLALLASAPVWLLRPRWREGLRERLGAGAARVGHALAGRQQVWVHAVSVGEVVAAGRLVEELDARLGREATGIRHGPRAIDIDILLLGELEVSEPRMTLPHEQLLSRRFVLIPALELDMDLRAPSGERLADALAALDVGEGVRGAGPPLACPAP